MNKDMENKIGWAGIIAPKTPEEFRVMMAIGNMMLDASTAFEEELGRFFDLGCSMEKLMFWYNAPEKYKVLRAQETKERMVYQYQSVNYEDNEVVGDFCRNIGKDTLVIGRTEDGKLVWFACNFKEEYLEKTNVDDAWNELQKNRKKK